MKKALDILTEMQPERQAKIAQRAKELTREEYANIRRRIMKRFKKTLSYLARS
jgi:hypothetical protein